MEYIDVSAAIITRGNKILIAQRSKECHQGEKWEFPGGKIEADETPQQCLQRELNEEFGIYSQIGSFLGESKFDYGDKKIRLLGFYVTHFHGQFNLYAHHEIRWISPHEFNIYDFAAADMGLIKLLLEKGW